jgi:hypothetical protein
MIADYVLRRERKDSLEWAFGPDEGWPNTLGGVAWREARFSAISGRPSA